MSDKWRFDPNEDYSNYDDESYSGRGNRRGFQPIKKGNKFRKDKTDGKRDREHDHRRDRHQ